MVRMHSAALVVLGLAACTPDEWTGVVYPDRSDLTQDVRIGVFDTLEACRSAALRTIKEQGWTERADYECGSNCRTPANLGGDLMICDETLQ